MKNCYLKRRNLHRPIMLEEEILYTAILLQSIIQYLGTAVPTQDTTTTLLWKLPNAFRNEDL